jgi:flagellar hook-length control protein FliK
VSAAGVVGKQESLLRPVSSPNTADQAITVALSDADLSAPATGRVEPLQPAYREMPVATALNFAVDPNAPTHSLSRLPPTPAASQALAGVRVEPGLEAAAITTTAKAGNSHDPQAITPSLSTVDSDGIAVATQQAAYLARFPLRWNRQLNTMLAQDSATQTVEFALSTPNNGLDEASSPNGITVGAIKNTPEQVAPSVSSASSEQTAPVTSYRPNGEAGATIATVTSDASLERDVAKLANAPLNQPVLSAPSGSLASPSTLARLDAAPSPATLAVMPETLHFNQKNWERTLGQQLNWMLNNQVQEAQIRVDPPNLGPLELRVSLHQNQTSVAFFSHEAVVREALEQALPRLREMLDAQGINLSQTQVSDQSLARQQAGSGGQPGDEQRGGRWPNAMPNTNTDLEEAKSPLRSRRVPGGVDDYA